MAAFTEFSQINEVAMVFINKISCVNILKIIMIMIMILMMMMIMTLIMIRKELNSGAVVVKLDDLLRLRRQLLY